MYTYNYNDNWEFWNERSPESKQVVHLPHDAMQTEKRLPGVKGGTTSGFYPGGKYIYTKKVLPQKDWEHKRIELEFDGVYMNSTVFLNGEVLGGRVYGYSHFAVELTGKLLMGQENEIRVIVDNTRTPNSRWYSGSGIYRDVKLYVGETVGFQREGIQVKTLSTDPTSLAVDIRCQGLESQTDDRSIPYQIRAQVRYLGILDTRDYGYRTEQMYQELIEKAPMVLEEVYPATNDKMEVELSIPDAKLWEEEHPELYAITFQMIYEDTKQVIDEQTIRYGIRSLTWNAQQGMCINGKTVHLRGGCIHHDNGMLGASEYRKAAFRRVSIMKHTGYNAIRMAHHPMSKVLLEACDELGMYVYEESFDMWESSKNDYDYSLYFAEMWRKDLTDLVAKDYNHPSVILYGIGNEVTDLGTMRGRKLQKEMVELLHSLDQSRPVTNACLGMIGTIKPTPLGKEKEEKRKSREDVVDPYYEDGDGKMRGSLLINTVVTLMPFLNKLLIKADKTAKNARDVLDDLDIAGFNYANSMMPELQKLCPDTILLNTETYPKSIGENWPVIEEHPAIVGDFMWTAWDYLGETGVGLVEYDKKRGQFSKPYPCVSAGCGAIDMTGQVDAQGAYASAVWHILEKPYIGVRPVNHAGENYFLGQWRGTDAVNSWSWDACDGKLAEVQVYSRDTEVELLLNDQSLGRKKLISCQANYQVSYQPGMIKAIAYDEQGRVTAESTLCSGDCSTRLTLHPEETCIVADGEDLAYVSIEITDDAGIRKMLSDQMIQVEVSGAGILVGLGSGNPVSHNPFTGTEYETYYGRAMAVIRSNGDAGEIHVKVHGQNLKEQEITIVAGTGEK